MANKAGSILRISLPKRPHGASQHMAVDWTRDPPSPKVDEDRHERNRQAVKDKYRRD